MAQAYVMRYSSVVLFFFCLSRKGRNKYGSCHCSEYSDFILYSRQIDRIALADITLKLSCRDCTHTLDLLYTI